MLLLKTRLKLTPDQETEIKAAMDADAQKRRELGRQMFTSGKIDPQAPPQPPTRWTNQRHSDSDQQASYKQVQADEQAARANTAATVQVTNRAPAAAQRRARTRLSNLFTSYNRLRRTRATS